MDHRTRVLYLYVLISLCAKCDSWGWFSSSSEKHVNSHNKAISKGYGGAFSVEEFNDGRAIELVEKAKNKMDASNTCWHNAYRSLFAACSEIYADEEKRSRFSWQLADCFQKDTVRPAFPFCDSESTMYNCLHKLSDDEHKIYLEFYLETSTICHQLQANVFKHETERLVNDLRSSAEYAENKLEAIEEKSEQMLRGSSQILGSLDLIDGRTQQVTEQTKGIENNLVDLLNHSAAVYERSKGIAASQSQLQKGQEEMKQKLGEGMDLIYESYNSLEQEINSIRKEAVEIEKEIIKVGDEMSLRMNNLQSKAEDIGDMAGLSLDKQKELLNGQGKALDGIQYLSKFQSQALEESRNALQQLAEYSSRQQEELLGRQKQLQEVHGHLMTNSKTILAAQEAFEAKQSGMIIALDKIFAMVNTLLVESRMINAILFYVGVTWFIYIVTSTKRTYHIRLRLFVGVGATLLIEISILWYVTKQETLVQTIITRIVRLLYLLLASAQYIYAIFTYRDYETLNHQILLSLIKKVDYMHQNRECYGDEDSDVEWSTWVDTDLPDDLGSLEDPNYVVPEEVCESSSTSSTTRKYNLRNRRR